MTDKLAAIEQQARKGRNFDTPPLHLWHPPLSGDIDIRIAADGTWYHEGRPIVRPALVRLFASLLRREADGDYYLVTPAEKWRIQVELHPLVVTEIDAEEEGGRHLLRARLNTGREVVIDAAHPLFLEPAVGEVAAVRLDHGLTAILSRAAWYRLVDSAEDVDGRAQVRSGDEWFPLQ
ncbi:DUF1285 domain-containing protein [Kineobactrum sediminis]|uniref:DUF1285 domain-containing protein n=1 Tax=Kineobactrum sediminis TaxID=1905677 RepID=A0A2N5Y152_9GAMM|nr:DUF1285 domain-containing protein [Kineobactrum sediminis]PLW82123.1 DUF1285 domain-containing protein [Kineobactrum sediminis]